MASYFPSLFQASSMPKRLLQYALSRLEFLDTDALDLDNLDIAFGKNSVFEFRDVGLRLEKLESLLELPASFELLKSRVILLRLTIPVDIYSSPILVDVNGVECQLCVKNSIDPNAKSRTNHDRIRKRRHSSSQKHKSRRSSDIEDDELDPAIPTVADLAQSFLETQPQSEETAALEAALHSESQEYGTESFMSEDGDNVVGTGTPLSLPGFMTKFLQEIVDRLQVRINNVIFKLDVDLPNDLARSTVSHTTEPVTLQLRVEKIDIEGVTHSPGAEAISSDGQSSPVRDGKRLISLSDICGTLTSEASFFSSLARSSAISYPAAHHSDTFSERRAASKAPSSCGTNSKIFDGTSTEHEPMTTSKLSQRSVLSESNSIIHALEQSVSSDHGRFDDASEDETQSNMSQSLHMDSELGSSSIFQRPSLMHHFSNHQSLRDEDDERELDAPDLYSLPAIQAVEKTSPESSYTRSGRSSMFQSSFLPGRKRFSEGRLSQSQVSLQSGTGSIAPEPHPQDPILQDAPHSGRDGDVEDDSSTPPGEDPLAQSQYFSHEDAESMYMSAISHTSRTQAAGAWSSTGEVKSSITYDKPLLSGSADAGRDNLAHALCLSPTIETPAQGNFTSSFVAPASPVENIHRSRTLSFSSSPVTEQAPKLRSGDSERSTASSDNYSRLSKQLFHLDVINIYLSQSTHTELDIQVGESLYGKSFESSNSTTQSSSVNVPGAFSAYLPQRASTPQQIDPVKQTKTASPRRNHQASGSEGPIELTFGDLQVQFDMSVGRLLYKLIQQINVALQHEREPQAKTKVSGTQNSKDKELDVSFDFANISVKFLERLDGKLGSASSVDPLNQWIEPPDPDVLLRTTLKGLRINSKSGKNTTKTKVTLHKFLFGYAQDSILSFDAGLQMRASTRDLKAEGVDVSAEITQIDGATRFEINTLPIHFSVDLQKLDETFSWFGGLSSVLNMGSSIASNATITATSPQKSKARGVRFDTPIRPEDKSMASQNKADVRIGGFVLDLIGSECSVGLETSAVKLVNRDTGVGVSIAKIRLSGPHLRRSNHDPAINLEVIGTRLEYLLSPRDSDLERLLNIITPSKTKYDQADDILLDTLVRQRKQGPVLSVSVENVQARIAKLDELSYFPELGEEVAKLATVAKYLPEADRPGMLVLLKVQKFDAHVDVNETVGTVHLSTIDVDIAQITLPVLVAISVGSVIARRNTTEELLGPASDANLRDPQSRAPAVMARMIGDELEPTIKIKLWNLKLEYRVPTLITLLGLADNASPKDLSSSLVASVATLTDAGQAQARRLLASEHLDQDDPNALSKPLNLDVTVKDCVLGLNPLGLPSKLLVVLTASQLRASLPKDQNLIGSVEVNKASLLIIDNVAHLLSNDAIQRTHLNSFEGNSQVTDFCAAGYVSVSYISSAQAKLQMSDDQDGDRCLDVEVRDDLFVLETCADSTQTLIGLMNGLAPPSIPSKVTKYRTRVIPVHDLLASLSGDAFGTAEGQYNFDDDFGLGQGSDIAEMAEESALDDLDFDSQYYKGDVVDPYEEVISEDIGASLHSARLTSTDTQDGVLLESLMNSPEEPEENPPLEFHDDYFATGSILEGTAHKWNSAQNTYDTSNASKIRKSPLKLCVRDVHIIWNLFDGYDWQHTRDVITKAVQDVESKAIEKRARNERRPTFDMDLDDDETVIGDFLFNSIYIGIPANRDPRELSAAINQELNDAATETESIATTAFTGSLSKQGGSYRTKSKKLRLNRSKHHKITFELKGVSVDLVTFPSGSGETQSSIDVRVHDLEVFDHIPSSTWKLFATYMQEAGERETGSSMVHIEVLNVKPIPELAASEIVLKVTVLPLRLHVDQDALDFITRFFEFKDDSAPINTSSTGDVPFLQRAEVNSVQVKLDFKPKRVDYAGLRSGHTTEFMNFLILEEADMVLRHTIIYGVSGFEKLGKCLNDIWMPDVKRNQLPGILAGLAPVRSLVNVGGGLQQLVVVPMREYKKDGRIVRSISKGAAAFAKTTGTELVKLGAKVAIGVQTVLQGAEGFLGPTIDNSDFFNADDEEEGERKKISPYANQPVGVMQGLRGGYAGLQRDLVIARDAIIAVPGEVMEGGSAAGVLKAVRKHAPTVILRPAIGVAKASGQILMGATNTLDPSNLQRVEAKYKKH